MTEEARKERLEIQAAFENQFYLLQNNREEIVGADSTVFAATASIDAKLEVINNIADALIIQGIPVGEYYPESGPGQQEISIRYTEALEASDWQVVFREIVRAIGKRCCKQLAHRHYLTASFLPKIFAETSGNGCYLHLTLWRDAKNITPDSQGICGLSSVARAFIAGILHYLFLLMLITTPSPNSYRPIRPLSQVQITPTG
jgi:glutamine synthetase